MLHGGHFKWRSSCPVVIALIKMSGADPIGASQTVVREVLGAPVVTTPADLTALLRTCVLSLSTLIPCIYHPKTPRCLFFIPSLLHMTAWKDLERKVNGNWKIPFSLTGIIDVCIEISETLFNLWLPSVPSLMRPLVVFLEQSCALGSPVLF